MSDLLDRLRRSGDFLRQSVTPPAPISNTVRQSIADAVFEAASLIESQAIERDRMHAALLTCSCPYPAKGRPSDETVATCTGAKVCGCSLGVAIGYVVPTRALNPNNPSQP